MSWDLSNILSATGVIASVTNIFVVIYIYTKWNDQKRKEVISDDAKTLIKEIKSFELEIFKAVQESPIDHLFIAYIEQKKDSMENDLKIIYVINKNLIYEPYINSITELIRKFQDDPLAIDSLPSMRTFFMTRIELTRNLNKVRLFIS